MTNNVYAAPVGNNADIQQPFAEIKFFSPSCRVNRLRYWAHITLALYAFLILASMAAMLGMTVNLMLGIFVGGTVYLGFLAFSIILGIQRLHDLDKSGWLWLLNFVPLVNLYVVVLTLFFPGTPQANRFGLPTPPSKTWHWVVTLSLPVLGLVLGVLGAFSNQYYSAYKTKVEASQELTIPAAE